jgi:hypothetical protein
MGPGLHSASRAATFSGAQVHTYLPPFHTLSPNQKAHVLDGDFSIERQVDRLPESLKIAFSALSGQPDFKTANPGEKYQATDVIVETGLPPRRLLFAGISKDKYFVHYEMGGHSHSVHIAVFGVDSENKVMFLSGGPGSHARDLLQLRSMVVAGRLLMTAPTTGDASQSRVITNCAATFVLDQGSGITLKPWCSMLPFRGQGEMIAVRHLHFRETVFVHDLVLFDNAILVEDIGGQSVDLVGF